ncbi:hypothetical protein A2U10_01140 [Fusobacterium necrophorum subsp. funduliforme]|uniref:HigA2-like helix-turn-helix domain-containing protein n=1 Tax=Fusobacterium necrophorum subsp. funduliforme TaxID=143387 RepID=A0A161QU08_9FUSO|nr:hypothetical protein [Fusobacterium necrophorum]KYL03824.1 hypothetical protein A2J07_11060 [Fusobacterium necrophorum subsp. funduliforme]KYM40955.1 hypothetical protein A2U10_01140 [Fusobacterium necrophorum subsp. funduliforme]KYM44553.1 hypothetical protein A2U08_02475 [Fusobacterium necrophorum subsp. funduliforme]KYM47214.1 hypothetical protein A2U04_08350 [Fusobacterium necrophorum subsp. funduliforme]KYM49574.1 hypothetical protein A2U06_06170 [Fusobacterium necrophorum subsp. fundu
MDTLEVFRKIDLDIRLNYNSKAEFGRKVGLNRKKISEFLKTLQKNCQGNDFNRLVRILEKAGYTITIEKINRD